MLVGFYFLLIRPQRNKQRAQQAMLSTLDVGDDVMTSGGIFGTVTEIDEDEGVVTVEIAPGTQIKMLRQGISQRFVEDENGSDADEDLDDDVTEDADRNP
jgi:preprotein translocase subunit YajC